MSLEWHVQHAGRVLGPFTWDQIEQLASSGLIRRDSLVRRGMTAGWIAAGHLQGLAFPVVDLPFEPPEQIQPGSDVIPVKVIDDDKVESLLAENSCRRVPCPYCFEKIHEQARKCKHCGEYLDPVLREIDSKPVKNTPEDVKPTAVGTPAGSTAEPVARRRSRGASASRDQASAGDGCAGCAGCAGCGSTLFLGMMLALIVTWGRFLG